jgi:hypothetical protein
LDTVGSVPAVVGAPGVAGAGVSAGSRVCAKAGDAAIRAVRIEVEAVKAEVRRM